MTRPTRAATSLPVVCLLLGALADPSTVAAEPGGHSRYVMAPADPTHAPADPTIAPGDPTFAPADPRDGFEPRDMTSPRAVRRALRGRSRDRIAPDQPTTNPQLRDLTDLPVASGRTGIGRRFESLFRSMPDEQPPVIIRRETPRIAPAEPQMITTHPPAIHRVAPAAPATPEPEAAPPSIQLAQGNPDPLPAPAAEQLALDEQRVLSLNKPINQIALVEPVDVEGLRPNDISAQLQPPHPPILLAGSLFCEAHPARYLYCFTHQPLYFEEANLERCGLTHCCCQPIVSAAQFVGRTALLPYSLIATPPCSCVESLGDCPTCHAYPCGIDWHR